MIFALFFLALALLWLPRLAHGLGRRLSPEHWSLITRRSMVTGTWAFGLSLLGLTFSTVSRTLGASRLAELCDELLGHLPHGAPNAGWIAATLLVLGVSGGALGYQRARRQLDLLYVEAEIGTHTKWNGVDLVVLPTSESIAYSRRNPYPQVVLSEGLVSKLGEAELQLLLRHEAVHLQRNDEKIFIALAAIKAALKWLPLVASSVAITRAAIERSADEMAAGQGPQRLQLASALMKAATPGVPAALTAFSSAYSLMERVDAMNGRIPPLRFSQRVLLLAASGLLRITGSAGVALGFLALTVVCAK
jgi:hypothetical protein